MRVLLDVNVVLDVLLDRAPYVKASAAVWRAVEEGKLQGLLAAHAVTTIYNLTARVRGSAEAGRSVNSLLRVFDVAAVDGRVIRQAALLAWPDFEDAVTACAAQAAGCDAIVTRDPRGLPDSPVRTLMPEAVRMA